MLSFMIMLLLDIRGDPYMRSWRSKIGLQENFKDRKRQFAGQSLQIAEDCDLLVRDAPAALLTMRVEAVAWALPVAP